MNVRSSHPDVFLRKRVLKIWSKFTGEKATLLKSHFGMGVFSRTPLSGCFWTDMNVKLR